jgi:pimeloyl-ACP methyl ester carboxylesterase
MQGVRRRSDVRDVQAILIHGAGHTSKIWRKTQSHLARPSLAVDLPGRAGKGGSLASLTVAEAARSVAADVRAGTRGDVILVGHSVAGTLLPSIASHLRGRVQHLVFLAGICAPEGVLPADLFAPGQSERMTAYLSQLRAESIGMRFEDLDKKVAHALDSLSFSCEPMRWAGISEALPRTFVRCLRDPIQSRDVQARFIQSCAAHHVIDIDTGHTPAVEAPAVLATILGDLVDRCSSDRDARTR